MRDYICEFSVSKIIDAKKMKSFKNVTKINENSIVYHSTESDDFKIYKYNEYTIIIDGEVYDQNHEYSINNLSFLYESIEAYFNGESDLFNKLNGSFNLIIYNEMTNKLVVINDRFATKPLYYYKNTTSIILSNKMSLIPKYYTEGKWNVNYNAVREFFELQMIFGKKTYINEVYSMENASIISWSDKFREQKYWTFGHKIIHDFNEKEFTKEFSDLIEKIIKFKTKDKKKYGIFMSGGMDSRAIVAADRGRNISEFFTIGDSFNYECQIAKKVALAHRANFTYLHRNKNFYSDILEESVRIGDGMYNYLNGHFINYADMTSKKVDVVFNGSLVEQLWQGTKFLKIRFSILNKKIPLPFLQKNDCKNNTIELLKANFPGRVANSKNIFHDKLLTDELIDISLSHKLIENFGTDQVPIQEAMDYISCDAYGKYSSHLNQLSINEAMIYRTAYDNRLIDKILEAPIKFRSSGNLLKNSITRLNYNLSEIPLANTGQKLKRSPLFHWTMKRIDRLKSINKQSVSYKQYKSSWPNYNVLIRDSKDLQQKIEKIIYSKEIFDQQIFNTDYIKDLYTKHMNNEQNNERLLFSLLTFGEWYKENSSFLNR